MAEEENVASAAAAAAASTQRQLVMMTPSSSSSSIPNPSATTPQEQHGRARGPSEVRDALSALAEAMYVPFIPVAVAGQGNESKDDDDSDSDMQQQQLNQEQEQDAPGVYAFGDRRAYLVFLNQRLMVRVGGGFVELDAFMHKYGAVESRKRVDTLDRDKLTQTLLDTQQLAFKNAHKSWRLGRETADAVHRADQAEATVRQHEQAWNNLQRQLHRTLHPVDHQPEGSDDGDARLPRLAGNLDVRVDQIVTMAAEARMGWNSQIRNRQETEAKLVQAYNALKARTQSAEQQWASQVRDIQRQTSEDSQTWQQRHAQVSERLEAVTQEADALRIKVASLELEISTQRQQFELKMQADAQAAKEAMRTSQADRSVVETRVASLTQKQSALQNTLQTERNAHQQEVLELRRQFEADKQEQRERWAGKLTEVLTQVRGELDRWQNALADANDAHAKEVADLRTEMAETSRAATQLRERDLAALRDELEQRSGAVRESTDSRISSLQSQLSEAMAETARAQDQVGVLQEAKATLERDLRAQRVDLTLKIARSAAEVERSKTAAQETAHRHAAEVQEWGSKLSNARSEIDALRATHQAELSRLSQQLQATEAKRSQARIEGAAAERGIRTERDELALRVKRLQAELQQQTAAVQSHEASASNVIGTWSSKLKEARALLESRTQEALAEQARLQTELAAAQRNADSLSAERDLLAQQVHQVSEDGAAKCERLVAEVAAAKAQADAVKAAHARDLNDWSNKLMAARNELDAVKADAQSNLQEASRQLADAQNEADDSRARRVQAERELEIKQNAWRSKEDQLTAELARAKQDAEEAYTQSLYKRAGDVGASLGDNDGMSDASSNDDGNEESQLAVNTSVSSKVALDTELESKDDMPAAHELSSITASPIRSPSKSSVASPSRKRTPAALRRRTRKLKEQLRVSQSKVEDVLYQLEQVKLEKQVLERDLRVTKADLQEHLDRAAVLQESVSAREASLKKAHAAHVEKLTSRLSAVRVEAGSASQHHLHQVHVLQDEMQALREQLDAAEVARKAAANEAERVRNECEEDVASARADAERFRMTVDQLRLDVVKQEEVWQTQISTINDQHELALRDLQEEVANRHAEAAAAEKAAAEAKEERATAQREAKALIQEHSLREAALTSEIERRKAQLLQEKERNAQDAATWSDRLAQLRQRMDSRANDWKGKRTEVTQHLEEARDECDRLHVKVLAMERDLAEQKQQADDALARQEEQHQSHLNEINSNLELAQAEAAAWKDKLEQLRALMDRQQSEWDGREIKITQQLDAARDEVAGLTHAKNSLERSHKTAMDDMQDKLRRAQDALERIKHDLLHSDEIKAQEVESVKSQMALQLKALHDRQELAATEWQAKQAAMAKKIQSIKSEVASLKLDKNAHQRQMKKLRDDFETRISGLIAEQTRERDIAEQASISSSKHVASLKATIEDKEHALVETQRLLDEKRKADTVLRANATQLEAEVARLSGEISTFTQLFGEGQDDALEDRISQDVRLSDLPVVSSLSELIDLVGDQRDSLRQLEEKLASLTKELAETQSNLDRINHDAEQERAGRAAEQADWKTLSHEWEQETIRRQEQEVELEVGWALDQMVSHIANEADKEELDILWQERVDQTLTGWTVDRMAGAVAARAKLAAAHEQMREMAAMADAERQDLETKYAVDMNRIKRHLESELSIKESLRRGFSAARAESLQLRDMANELRDTNRTMNAEFAEMMETTRAAMFDAFKNQQDHLNTTLKKYEKETKLRRKYFNKLQEVRGNIRVFCRCRPVLPIDKHDLEGEPQIAVDFQEGREATQMSLQKGPKKLEFEFDQVYGLESTNVDVFEGSKGLITSVLDGFNCCIFAYGQTGSGKTWTMEGSPEHPGVIQRALNLLFEVRDERNQFFDYQLKVTMMEIYNEQCRDLLRREKTSNAELKIHKDQNHRVWVEGLEEFPVETPEDVLAAIRRGQNNRATSQTLMNRSSSRSHSLFTVHIKGRNNQMGIDYNSKLNLIDLAGSERLTKSGATGVALLETKAINKSLASLGNVIQGLQKKSSHIPYRDSKLTYLLQDSLGGQAKVLMILNISPTAYNSNETFCSLTFGERARKVELGQQNVVVKKAVSRGGGGGATAAIVVGLQTKIRELEALAKRSRMQMKVMKREIRDYDKECKALREYKKLSVANAEKLAREKAHTRDLEAQLAATKNELRRAADKVAKQMNRVMALQNKITEGEGVLTTERFKRKLLEEELRVLRKNQENAIQELEAKEQQWENQMKQRLELETQLDLGERARQAARDRALAEGRDMDEFDADWERKVQERERKLQSMEATAARDFQDVSFSEPHDALAKRIDNVALSLPTFYNNGDLEDDAGRAGRRGSLIGSAAGGTFGVGNESGTENGAADSSASRGAVAAAAAAAGGGGGDGGDSGDGGAATAEDRVTNDALRMLQQRWAELGAGAPLPDLSIPRLRLQRIEMPDREELLRKIASSNELEAKFAVEYLTARREARNIGAIADEEDSRDRLEREAEHWRLECQLHKERVQEMADQLQEVQHQEVGRQNQFRMLKWKVTSMKTKLAVESHMRKDLDFKVRQLEAFVAHLQSTGGVSHGSSTMDARASTAFAALSRDAPESGNGDNEEAERELDEEVPLDAAVVRTVKQGWWAKASKGLLLVPTAMSDIFMFGSKRLTLELQADGKIKARIGANVMSMKKMCAKYAKIEHRKMQKLHERQRREREQAEGKRDFNF